MITSTIILVLLYVLQQAVNVLPSGTLPTEVYNTFTAITGYLADWNDLFPVTELITVLQLVVAFQVVVFGFKAVVWVYGRIRGVSSK